MRTLPPLFAVLRRLHGPAMWHWLSEFILRYRVFILVFVLAITATLGYFGQYAEIQQEFVKVIPEDDPEYQAYVSFKNQFGEDGNAVIIGLSTDNFFTPLRLNTLATLSDELMQLKGVDRVLNLTRLYQLERDDSLKQFRLIEVMPDSIRSQAQADSLRYRLGRLPFYDGILFNKDLTSTLFLVTINEKVLRSKERHQLINRIQETVERDMQPLGIRTYYSGVPYLRSYIAQKLPKELQLFLLLAVVFTAVSLYVLFRSLYAVFIPLMLIVVSTICTFGWIGVLGYKIGLITALIPPLIVVISVAPFVYMISDYHQEFAVTKNNRRALSRMLRRLGLVSLMISGNTALGFLALFFTNVIPLREFGMLAFLSAVTTYVFTILGVPALFSILPDPSGRRLDHLESRPINRMLEGVVVLVARRRGWIFTVAALVAIAGAIGLTRLKAVSYMVDDLPKDEVIFTDLAFLEQEFKAVMPFEIEINTQQKGGVRKLNNLRAIAQVQDTLASYPEISRTISLADAVKWARQGLYNDEPSQYLMPNRDELLGLERYLRRTLVPKGDSASVPILNNLVDSSYTHTRITGFVKDIGSQEMPILLGRIEKDLSAIFDTTGVPPERQVKFAVTGTTKIFLKANDYLINNLNWSLVSIFTMVALQMLLLFRSPRIMLLAIIPNLIPLVFTAGIMGYFGIPLKPSTALIYGIAFTIAVDDSIHYLSAYRYKRKRGRTIPSAVTESLRGTGMSMVYTSVVLFSGFVIFAPSAFSSTQALGILTSATLFIAMFSNLVVLPALLVQFDREKQRFTHAPIDDTLEELDEEDATENTPTQP